MQNIALLPARGGSKRIPKKNIKNFLGKPIIHYPIAMLQSANIFHQIVVSSDDDEIIEIAKQAGAIAPFKRPDSISDDYATTRDVISHAIEALQLKIDDCLCCIYPTAVLIQKESVIQGRKMLNNGFKFALSITEFDYSIWRGFRALKNGALEMLYPQFLNTRSQDLDTIYHDAGGFYWGSVEAWKSNQPLFGDHSYGVLLPSSQTQDIDTPQDWELAELKYHLLHSTHK
ncbi:pseudaminic acid cytidylyltransferase [Helicobacter monodelphidis]|uniref:pseudaminic acid cytidylyltransferase n=1 Tax=Helicobacter sp. 15-1451 TaxID=2004995 RepID=UPI000DCED45F|nr:pseudaminic acid cytidylyltransferase [Helicobacter sp. 15-1451]RAX57479.1 pseudaminic acid cytidylyltransferase [Helicobacter sp. 15-1451]